ncbi:unnamed protein product [Timema podura]|uniref:C2H2-type domain-containing protein n=1 Tax=Timema podura TaxID=61482 RepID=A0ABN7NIX3_TIMPD|nr:unnamed protein product [Timema podura]
MFGIASGPVSLSPKMAVQATAVGILIQEAYESFPLSIHMIVMRVYNAISSKKLRQPCTAPQDCNASNPENANDTLSLAFRRRKAKRTQVDVDPILGTTEMSYVTGVDTQPEAPKRNRRRRTRSQKRNLRKRSAPNPDSLRCKVCNSPYQVQRGEHLDWQHGFTTQHWLQTVAIVTCMCVSAAGAWVTIQLFEDAVIRCLAAGSALLIQYVCVRFLGLHTVVAYQRAKVSALSIVGGHVSTISETVAVDIPKGPQQAHI